MEAEKYTLFTVEEYSRRSNAPRSGMSISTEPSMRWRVDRGDTTRFCLAIASVLQRKIRKGSCQLT